MTEQQRTSIGPVHLLVAARSPTGASDKVQGVIGVALETETAPRDLQQPFVRGAVSLVAIQAALGQLAGEGAVRVEEGTALWGMTGGADLDPVLLRLVLVGIVAVGAADPTLPHRMVAGQLESGRLLLVASVADALVGPPVSDLVRRRALAVAIPAAHPGLGVLAAPPKSRLQVILMTA